MDFHKKSSDIKFHENLSSLSQVVDKQVYGCT